MIAYIKGSLEDVTQGKVVIELNGVGYEIQVPANLPEQLPSIGSELKLHTYLHVREDAMQLFGFLTKGDL